MNDDHFLTFPAVALNLKIMISYVRKNFHSLNSDLLMGFSPQMQYVDTSLHYTKIRCSKIAGWLVSLNMKTTHGHRKMQNEKKKKSIVWCVLYSFHVLYFLFIIYLMSISFTKWALKSFKSKIHKHNAKWSTKNSYCYWATPLWLWNMFCIRFIAVWIWY